MTACQPLPCSARVMTERMASVSRCRAAGRRWCARAITALQMPAFTGTRYQSKARPHALALTRNGFVPVVPVTEDRLRTRKPSIHAVVPVSSVVPVKMSIPRSQSLPNVPGGLTWHGGLSRYSGRGRHAGEFVGAAGLDCRLSLGGLCPARVGWHQKSRAYRTETDRLTRFLRAQVMGGGGSVQAGKRINFPNAKSSEIDGLNQPRRSASCAPNFRTGAPKCAPTCPRNVAHLPGR